MYRPLVLRGRRSETIATQVVPLLLLYGILLFLVILFRLTLTLVDYQQTQVLGVNSELSAAKILSLVNLERQQHGLKALILNPQLEQAAQAKLSDMIHDGYFAHTTATANPWQFIDAAGYTYLHAGENLARDFTDEYDLIQGWLASPAHQDNLLSSVYTETGLAVSDASSGAMIVQLFATPLPLYYEHLSGVAFLMTQLQYFTQPYYLGRAFEFCVYFTLVFLSLYLGYLLLKHQKQDPGVSKRHWHS